MLALPLPLGASKHPLALVFVKMVFVVMWGLQVVRAPKQPEGNKKGPMGIDSKK
jgi:hypothetical protein